MTELEKLEANVRKIEELSKKYFFIMKEVRGSLGIG